MLIIVGTPHGHYKNFLNKPSYCFRIGITFSYQFSEVSTSTMEPSPLTTYDLILLYCIKLQSWQLEHWNSILGVNTVLFALSLTVRPSTIIILTSAQQNCSNSSSKSPCLAPWFHIILAVCAPSRACFCIHSQLFRYVDSVESGIP